MKRKVWVRGQVMARISHLMEIESKNNAPEFEAEVKRAFEAQRHGALLQKVGRASDSMREPDMEVYLSSVQYSGYWLPQEVEPTEWVWVLIRCKQDGEYVGVAGTFRSEQEAYDEGNSWAKQEPRYRFQITKQQLK